MTDFDPTMSANARLRERMAQDASDDADEIVELQQAPPRREGRRPVHHCRHLVRDECRDGDDRAADEAEAAMNDSGRRSAIDLSRPIKIHICKDGTFTYRAVGEPIFNGRALPVFSVNSIEEAQQLQVLACWLVKGDHPQLPAGAPWYKVNLVRQRAIETGKATLEYDDLQLVAVELAQLYQIQSSRRARNARSAPHFAT